MKGYTHKYEIREHRAGGGVSLFVNNDIRFEVRSDTKVNLDDVNTLFIEISKNSIKSDKKCNCRNLLSSTTSTKMYSRTTLPFGKITQNE